MSTSTTGKKFIRNPSRLIGEDGCKALVLSVSDNHANILLWTDVVEVDSIGIHNVVDENRSLIKINVVPKHKDQLVVKNRVTDMTELDQATRTTNENDSQSILNFLSKLDYSLTSESGAEYSYYTATSRSSWHTPVESILSVFGFGNQTKVSTTYKMELISPASERQIQRSLPSPSMSLIEETPELYTTSVEPFIQSIVKSGSLSWIENVVNGTKEVERLLYKNEQYIINIDTKWRSHPDAKTIPRDQWYGHKSIEDLYCLAIVSDETILSLRDLRQCHIPLLQSMVKEGQDVIETVYGVKKDQLRIFVHYHPQFYRFHVHFTRLENEIGCQVERGHLLSDIIQNLQLSSNYYAEKTISYKVKTSSELYLFANK